MATAHRRTAIANGKKRKNRARRKLTRAQILAGFGGKRRQSAAKGRRKAKRAASKKNRATPKKKRNTAKHSHRPRTVAKHSRPKHRNAAKRKRHTRRNVGEVVSLTLGSAMNPARKGKMATTKKHHRRPKQNAGRRKHHRNGRRMHRNPFGGGWSNEISQALFVIAGAVGSKLGAQFVLGTSNTGVMGYAGNLAVGGALALATKAVLKNPKAAAAVFSGSVVEVILRMIGDYTPFGSYVSGLGMGDYFASNWVAPQRYTDALNSANVQIPAGWAPTTVIQSAAPPSAVGMGSDSIYGGGGSLY
jgi:hypothetical protein